MTVREIADYFGVAPSTVSIVLNDRPGIRKEMREKITASLIENGYTIRKKKTEPIGSVLFIYYKSTDYLAARKDNTFTTYLTGIEEICAENQYGFSIANATADTIDQVLADAQSEHLGIIMLGTEYYDAPCDSFFRSSIPLVLLDAYFPEYPLNTVNMDNSHGVEQAISLLVENGHQKIGYLKSCIEFGCLRDRADRIYSAIRRHINDRPACVIPVSQRAELIQQEIQDYLDSGSPVPTAFIADNDIIAVSAMQTFQENGYRIPEDLSIIGYDDSEFCTIIRPHLTTVHANQREMARQAARRLFAMIESGPSDFIRISVGTSLISRNTVGPARL